VYDVFVLDPSNNIHRVIVDPENGKVLSNQQMPAIDMVAMTHPPMGIMNRGGSLGMEMMGTLLSTPHDSMMMQGGMMMGAQHR
jgi:hypothetical protein